MVTLFKAWITSFSEDKARGYVHLIKWLLIFLGLFSGWGAYFDRARDLSVLEQSLDTALLAASDNANMVVKYEKKCRGGGFRYRPSDPVRRLLRETR